MSANTIKSVFYFLPCASLSFLVGCSSGAGATDDAGSNDAGNGNDQNVMTDAGYDGPALPDGAVLTPVTFTPIASSDPDLVAPGRAAETWNGVDPGTIDIPLATSPAQSLNYYDRFNWQDLENQTKGKYDWTLFDKAISTAIDEGKSFSFGVMPVCDGCSPSTVGGHGLAYPTYLHNLMQAESPKDWATSDGIWVPNWNSESYLSSWESLLAGIASHIQAGSHNGKKYADAIYYVDIRGYGNYGEWHTYPWTSEIPNGTAASSTSLERIIDAHVKSFPDYPLVSLIAAFDGSNVPAAVTAHALTGKNTWGGFGWRRDNWGDPGYKDILENNPGSYNGSQFSTLIMSQWQRGPIVGEPLNSSFGVSQGGSCDFWELPTQVAKYHATSFGNGNIPNPNSACAVTNLRAASKASGYRLVLTGGALTSSIGSDRTLGVVLAWQNIGLAPPYQSWSVVFELHDASDAVVWSGTSSMALKLFLPQSSATTVEDTFALPATLKVGAYTLRVIVTDPTAYKAPLPLAIQGRATNGSYLVGSVTLQ